MECGTVLKNTGNNDSARTGLYAGACAAIVSLSMGQAESTTQACHYSDTKNKQAIIITK